jgi:hypothetical protein
VVATETAVVDVGRAAEDSTAAAAEVHRAVVCEEGLMAAVALAVTEAEAKEGSEVEAEEIVVAQAVEVVQRAG